MDPHFDGVIFKTHAAELRRRLGFPHPPFCIIDVRPAEAFGAGHVPGAISADAEGLARGFPPGTSASTEFFLLGADLYDAGVREAAVSLRELGAHRVVELPGGMVEWRVAGYPEEASGTQAA